MICKPLHDFLSHVIWLVSILLEGGAARLPQRPWEILVEDINVEILVDSFLVLWTLLLASIITIVLIGNDDDSAKPPSSNCTPKHQFDGVLVGGMAKLWVIVVILNR